jgi:dihydroflavonol-4-reductase
MKILVTGATGFLGSWIAREAVAAGHSVRVLVRRTSKLEGLAGVAVETATGDVVDRATIDLALDGMEAVIHAAGSVGQRPRDEKTLYAVNVGGAKNVLEAAKARGLRVVHTSSISAIGFTPEPVVQDERSPYRTQSPPYHYGESKRQGELVALEMAKNGLDVVVLNPGTMFGPGDVYFTSTRMVLEYLKGRLRFVPRGGVSYCDIRDAARAHVAALTRGQRGERYIVSGHNLTLHDFLGRLSALTGMGGPRRLPQGLATALALLSEGVAKLVPHSLEEVNRAVVKHGALFNWVDSSKAERELGYRIRPLEESLTDTLRDFLARGVFPAKTEKLRALREASP